MGRVWIGMLGAALVGCAVDSGPPADSRSFDSDGDGLSDADELALGTNLLSSDTDGDGYLDDDEVFEGTDPTDARSRIYQGNWPYYRDKDELRQKAFDGEPIDVGERMPRLIASDQYRDTFDSYDLGDPDGEVDWIVVQTESHV